jgi:hypothetical protein
MAPRAISPDEFARAWKVDMSQPYTERLADFLAAAVEQCPKRFFSKSICAKVAYGLGRVPASESDYVKKRLSGTVHGANAVMMRKHGREIFNDPIDGLRATVNDEDLMNTKHSLKRRRVQSAVASLRATDSLVKPANLSPAAKRDLQNSRQALALLEKGGAMLPALTAKKEE